MRKAGNVIEIAMILCVVTIVTIGTLIVYNNQNLRLALLSAIHFKPINLNTMSEGTAKQTIPYNKTETAGSNALTKLGMSSADFESAITNITYGDLEDAMEKDSTDNNIATFANELKGPLGLNFEDITATNITGQTLSDLVKVLNGIYNNDLINSTNSAIKAAANGFIERFSSLLTAAGKNAKIAASASPTPVDSSLTSGSGTTVEKVDTAGINNK